MGSRSLGEPGRFSALMEGSKQPSCLGAGETRVDWGVEFTRAVSKKNCIRWVRGVLFKIHATQERYIGFKSTETAVKIVIKCWVPSGKALEAGHPMGCVHCAHVAGPG